MEDLKFNLSLLAVEDGLIKSFFRNSPAHKSMPSSKQGYSFCTAHLKPNPRDFTTQYPD